MKDRLQSLIQSSGDFFDKIWSHLGFIKYLLVAFVLSLLAIFVSLVIWSRVKPIGEYRTLIEKKLKSQIGVETFRSSQVSWAAHWQTLSFGIQLNDVVVSHKEKRIDGSIPKLRLLWMPVKVFLGSLSIRAEMDGSTWQYSGEMNKENTEEGVSANRALFKDYKIPNFWERRLDYRFVAKDTAVSMVVGPGVPILLSKSNVDLSLLGHRSYFKGTLSSLISKNSDLGELSGELKASFGGAFQYVEKMLAGISVDQVDLDFSDSVIDGWGLYKTKSDPLHAKFGIQMLVDEEGNLSTLDVKEGLLKFSDLDFIFDGDQKNASGSAFKWILKNQQLKDNKLPFQVLHQAKISGPIQAEGKVSVSSSWDLAAAWTLRANGLSFSALDLKDRLDPRTTGKVLFNLAFDGGYSRRQFYSSGFQLKIDAEEAHLISKTKAFVKPKGQPALLQILFDIRDNVLTLKPSVVNWTSFRSDFSGKIDNLTEYLLDDAQAPFALTAQINRLDISKIAPYLSFVKQNPVPKGTLEFAGAVSGVIGGSSFEDQINKNELAWRVDQLSLSDFMANVDSGIWLSEQKDKGTYLSGELSLSLNFKGRGRGALVQSSNLQGEFDVSQSEFVIGDFFRKTLGVPASFKVGLRSVPNKLEFYSSKVKFLDNEFDFSGELNQGSKSKIALSFSRPIDLAKWRGFFRARDNVPLEGSVSPKVYLTLASSVENMDRGIDWSRVGVSGDVIVTNLKGLTGAWQILDGTSGHVRLGRGKLELKNFLINIGGQKLKTNGEFYLPGNKLDLSFYDFVSNKEWKSRLVVESETLNLGKFLRNLSAIGGASKTIEGEKNSDAAKEWIYKEEIKELANAPVLKKLSLELDVTSKTLVVGSWILRDAKGAVSVASNKIKYQVSKGLLSKGGIIFGSGVLDLQPKEANFKNEVMLSGTWNFKNAAIVELYGHGLLAQSKLVSGQFSGVMTYAKTLSSLGVDEHKKLSKEVYEGVLESATIKAITQLMASKIDNHQFLSGADCKVSETYSGKYKSVVSEDGNLKVEVADWRSVDTKDKSTLFWTLNYEADGFAKFEGNWIPSSRCLGTQLNECVQKARQNNAVKQVGGFNIKGPWEKLSFSWQPDAWDLIRDCKLQMPTTVKELSSEALDKENLKKYLQKNAN